MSYFLQQVLLVTSKS